MSDCEGYRDVRPTDFDHTDQVHLSNAFFLFASVPANARYLLGMSVSIALTRHVLHTPVEKVDLVLYQHHRCCKNTE